MVHSKTFVPHLNAARISLPLYTISGKAISRIKAKTIKQYLVRFKRMLDVGAIGVLATRQPYIPGSRTGWGMVPSAGSLANPIWANFLELVTPVLIISSVLVILAFHRHMSSSHHQKEK